MLCGLIQLVHYIVTGLKYQKQKLLAWKYICVFIPQFTLLNITAGAVLTRVSIDGTKTALVVFIDTCKGNVSLLDKKESKVY